MWKSISVSTRACMRECVCMCLSLYIYRRNSMQGGVCVVNSCFYVNPQVKSGAKNRRIKPRPESEDRRRYLRTHLRTRFTSAHLFTDQLFKGSPIYPCLVKPDCEFTRMILYPDYSLFEWTGKTGFLDSKVHPLSNKGYKHILANVNNPTSRKRWFHTW